MIESALRPAKHRPPGPDRLVERNQPKPPSSRAISSHRKALEDEGVESGRDVHEKYRKEVIQMKRELAELRSTEHVDQDSAGGETWLEQIGEKFGDFLAEPSRTPDSARGPGGLARAAARPRLRPRIARGTPDRCYLS